MITKERALEILKGNIENENLRKHHYAVAAAMRALHNYFEEKGETCTEPVEAWEIVGLLHDADYEETKNDPENHTLVLAEQLEEEGVSEKIIRAIKAHNCEYTHTEPQSKLEWSLIACDDLTGLVVAVALVHPTKLEGVSVESVMKKFDSSSFAAGADRERIVLCEEKLGIPLEDFVGIVLSAMKQDRDQLGL
ncbi:MAG: HDIG domain-containing protein [Patescibacteria group bacterium]|nr:HDIG domain-containing protein [Patescibacteria group bacterium]